MTVAKIHTDLGILLQKINTHKSKNFLPQELDILFNLTLNNFKNKKTDVKSSIKQVSLFDTQTSLDSISSLFETVTLYPNKIDKEEASISLPFNFYGWINAIGEVGYDCDDSLISTNTNKLNKEYSLSKLSDIPIDTINSFLITISYKNKEDQIITKTLFDFTALPQGYIIQDNNKDYMKSFIFISALLRIINKNLNIINEAAANKIYVKYDNNLEQLIITSYDYLVITLATNLPNYSFVLRNKFLQDNVLKYPIKAIVSVNDTEYTNHINNSTLSSSNIKELRADRTSKELIVHLPKSVNFSKVTLTYIRFPRQIDYLLGIGSDLPDNIVNKVIADTAQLIKGIIASDSYEKFIRENTLIE